MSTNGPSSAQSSTSGYAGKAHEYVPEFSGRSSDYREYRKRLTLYEKKMALAGREKETAFNVLCTLKGRAWDACEDIPMDALEGTGSMKAILERLDKIFKFDAITELPGDFETFFVTLARKKNATLQEYSGDFERALRRLESHGVNLPDKVVGWYFMRRAGLSQSQRQMVMTSIGTETLSLESVRKVMNFVIGQDSVPDQHDRGVHKHGPPKWRQPFHKESIYYEEDDDGDAFEDEDLADETFWAEEGDEAEDEEFEEEINLISDDLAAEYDDVLAGYTEARQRLNAMRMSRGYYPVVAMIPGEQGHGKGSNSNYTVGKGKGKSKSKGKPGKGSSKQMPKAPSAKARGRAVLGAEKCLRCGQAGHRARNCPAAGKRKAEASLETDVNMVEDEEIQLTVTASQGQPDDVAMMDCGAGSVLTSEEKLKSYLKHLENIGFKVSNIPVFRCKKGFRFGNGNKNITSVCLLVPTFIQGKRRDILMYVIPGSAPFLFGRPILEALDITISYSTGKIKWGKKKWKVCPRGSRGEFVCHMAEDAPKLLDAEPDRVLLPDDFEQHVRPEILSTDMFFDGSASDMINVTEDAVNSVMEEAASFTSAKTILDLQKIDKACEKSAPLSHPGETMPKNSFAEMGESFIEAEAGEEIQTQDVDPGPPHESENDENQGEWSRLPSAKLTKLIHNTEQRIKEMEEVFKATPLMNFEKRYVVWEVFAGEGRVTTTANRRAGMCAERFSLREGWDFTLPEHRVAFLRRLRKEEPDVVLLSPECKLWSALQELTIASKPGYAEKLDEMREWNHDNILMFCSVVYEHQRRRDKIALCEHPRRSKAWQTQAFEEMQGWDAHVDQCMFGLRLPNDKQEILPVQKPTTFRVTSQSLHDRLTKVCDGNHHHTHLEGNIPGVGLRSWLAESYPQGLATHLVNCIRQELMVVDKFLQLMMSVKSLQNSFEKPAKQGRQGLLRQSLL